MPKQKRVLIDANSMVMRTGYSHLSGIGRTTLELAKALDGLNEPGFTLRLLTQTFRGRVPVKFQHLKITNVPWPIGPRFDWLKQSLPLLELAAPHDLLHVAGNFAKVHRVRKTVATIHDTMFFSYPEDFLGHEFARQEVPKFAQAIRAIATPSESAKSDIVHYLGVPPEKVTVIPWGVDRKIFNASDKAGARQRVAAAIGTDRPYFLTVSCSHGRKNTISVLHAYREALRAGLEHDLLLVWGSPPDSYRQEFELEINAGRIRFLKHVSDEQLGDLYAGGTATFFPSRYEGFGLPVLESLACGTPVVTCRNSSLAEVGGNVAIYVNPHSVEDMADLMRMYDESAMGGSVHDVSFYTSQADQFRWLNTASAYASFYQEYAGDL